MSARRALVVDDSRSARAFLTRILERYELAVDEVESAEQAIEYLSRQRPDVIFMDHLMPGMDGFQAVQSIKNNPRTATIPIMMYTSQEGELYLSQARALGAIGVLPKQIKPADVPRALEQLRLWPERSANESAIRRGPATSTTAPAASAAAAAGSETGAAAGSAARAGAGATAPGATAPPRFAAAAAPAVAADAVPHAAQAAAAPMRDTAVAGGSSAAAGRRAAAGAVSETDASEPGFAEDRRRSGRPDAPALPAELRSILDAMLAHHDRELRNFVVENLESQAERIVADVRLLLQDSPAAAPPAPPTGVGRRAVLGLAAAAIIAAGVFAGLWAQRNTAARAQTAELALSQQALGRIQQTLQALQSSGAATAATARVAPGAVNAASAADPAANSLVQTVPFGEEPLAGSRVAAVSQLLSRLRAQGFEGVVQIRSIPGRYCMVDNAAGTPMLAAATQLYSKCTEVGNPLDDDGAGESQSIAFADMIATARAGAGNHLDIQISDGSPDEVVTPYPTVSDTLTAGQWNRVAASNNRVEVHWHPTH